MKKFIYIICIVFCFQSTFAIPPTPPIFTQAWIKQNLPLPFGTGNIPISTCLEIALCLQSNFTNNTSPSFLKERYGSAVIHFEELSHNTMPEIKIFFKNLEMNPASFMNLKEHHLRKVNFIDAFKQIGFEIEENIQGGYNSAGKLILRNRHGTFEDMVNYYADHNADFFARGEKGRLERDTRVAQNMAQEFAEGMGAEQEVLAEDIRGNREPYEPHRPNSDDDLPSFSGHCR